MNIRSLLYESFGKRKLYLLYYLMQKIKLRYEPFLTVIFLPASIESLRDSKSQLLKIFRVGAWKNNTIYKYDW